MRTIVALAVFALTIVSVPAAKAQGRPGGGGGLPSLKTVPVPKPANLEAYVRDNEALVALGKALFWDMQAGSDGRTACASCHFHAGADHRSQNQLATATGAAAVTPNRTLSTDDFPFHKLSNPANNRSAAVTDTHQIAGSAGVVHRSFYDVVLENAFDDGADLSGQAAASSNGINVRQVTGRNAPSVINAVFNVRNFWDGRASRTFTGATPFGASDPGLNALVLNNGQLERQQVSLSNSSLASQAVGPALNAAEMSYDGRTWPKLGRKMLSLAPLGRQQVASDDSVLGAMANPDGKGLRPAYTYVSLIQSAFQPKYWNASTKVEVDGASFSQMEVNFSIFWGLAIQAYESTLVSDNTRVDQFLEGRRQALTGLEQQGLNEFAGGGSQCTQCHQGAEFTAASFTNVLRPGGNPTNPQGAGFFRTGVSPIAEDVGLAGTDGFGLPLFALATRADDGAFKSPGLRNVELTGPYFHNGGQATLEQVVAFYARNGDFPAGGNLGPGIGRINLNANEQASLVALLKALTDDRVRYEQAPFDHPALCVPNGAVESSPGVLALDNSDARFSLSALDRWAFIPPSGKNGNAAPLQTFEELLLGIGNDGTRAHTLTESCVP